MKIQEKVFEITIASEGKALHDRLDMALIKEQAKVPRSKMEQWEEDNWEKKLYKEEIDSKEVLVFPEKNIRAHLIEACKKYKVSPPKDVGRTWTSYFKSSIFIVDGSAPIECEKITPYGDFVCIQGKNSKVWKVRPCIHNWKMTFKLTDFGSYLNKETLEEILEVAGKFIGIGNGRPLYGRYKVIGVKAV